MSAQNRLSVNCVIKITFEIKVILQTVYEADL